MLPILLAPLMLLCFGCGGSQNNPVDPGTVAGAASGGTAGQNPAPGIGGAAGSSGEGASSGSVGSGGSPANLAPIGPSTLPAPSSAQSVPKPSGTAGEITVLHWAGFTAALTYTFDDANSTQIANYSQLNGLGVPMTFYMQTGKTEAKDPVWATAIKDGHEIGNHTKTHQKSGATIAEDTDEATTFIKTTLSVTPWTMAAPYGSGDYVDIARTRFLINRGVSEGMIGPNDSTNPFNVPCHIPAEGATAAALNAKVDGAQKAGKWQVVLVHGFKGGTDGAYQPVELSEFTSNVTYAKSLGDVWIGTMVDVGAYWLGEKAFSSVTPTVSGGSKVWTWQLPANFPPGKHLRVKVDGGTLTQNGIALEWDSHGYYELALDAGSVTLSP